MFFGWFDRVILTHDTLAAFLLQNQSGKLFVEVFAIGMAITESDNS